MHLSGSLRFNLCYSILYFPYSGQDKCDHSPCHVAELPVEPSPDQFPTA